MSKTKAVEPARRLSLWDIEAAWVPLLDARIAAETDPELSDERPACETCKGVGAPWNNSASVPCSACGGEGSFASPRELAIQAAEVALAEHAEREITKADSYIGLIRYLESAAVTRRAEAERNTVAARIIENMLAGVKATAVNAMTVMERKRIDGSAGALTVKGNGGVAPLLITDEALVPLELCKCEGWINAHDYGLMFDAMRRITRIDWLPRANFKRVPDNAAIRAKLNEPCLAITNGLRCTAGRLPNDGPAEDWPTCATCGGSGKAGVSGCRLEPRGVHLEIR